MLSFSSNIYKIVSMIPKFKETYFRNANYNNNERHTNDKNK